MRRVLALVVLSSLSCASEGAVASIGDPANAGRPLPVVHAPWLSRRAPRPPPAPPQSAPTASTSVVIEATPAPPLGPLSGPLRAASLRSPFPGGTLAGYTGDTGLDIAGSPRPVHAIAAARVDYAEKGHTQWVGPKDTPWCARLTLDQPIPWKGHAITHAYYAHLSSVAIEQKEGAPTPRHVEAGEVLGTSGIANGVQHLHLGLLLDGHVEQDDWTYVLREGEVRKVLGGYENGEVLPK